MDLQRKEENVRDNRIRYRCVLGGGKRKGSGQKRIRGGKKGEGVGERKGGVIGHQIGEGAGKFCVPPPVEGGEKKKLVQEGRKKRAGRSAMGAV